jgi:HAD superfamily hydrolase (TIGR01490 family)
METTSLKDNNISQSYIAFFDLDRTIIKANSGSILVRQAYKMGNLSIKTLVSAIYQSYLYKFNLRDTDKIILKMGSWLKGFPLDTLTDLSDFIVNRFLLNAIHPEIREEIRFHKEHNAKVVLLSSAISSICVPVALHLEMDSVICTEMEAINGILTGYPVGNYCFEEEKVVRLIEFCKKHNVNPLNSWYYGDSIADLPVLYSVGNPVCINPDKKLTKAALKRGWKIHNWHHSRV